MMDKIHKSYEMFVRAASSLESPFLLIVRLYWGWQFMQTGWGKSGDLGKVTNFFTTLGIPFPALNAYFISGLEFVGGILLAVGLGSRLVAFLLAADMAVAYYIADHDALLAFFSDPDKFYAAAPFTFLVASLIILIFGPGRLALDTLIGRRYGQRTQQVRATRPARLQDSVSIPQP
jgi:putative oxidoreductase